MLSMALQMMYSVFYRWAKTKILKPFTDVSLILIYFKYMGGITFWG